MSENKLNFIDLQRFLLEEMEMDADYQPIMIKTLLNAPQKTATKDEIAEKIKELDPLPNDKNFKDIPVYEVLTERRIVKRDGDKFVLNTEELTTEQLNQLSVLCNWKIENLPIQSQIQDLIRAFDENRTLFAPDRLTAQEREKLRSEFVSDFSKEKISNLQLDEYVPGKPDPNTGAVNKSTFCYRLENTMDKLSALGIRSAFDFGVYYNKQNQKYEYKGDYPSAEAIFDKIKTEILTVIEAGEQYHTDHDIQSLSTTLGNYRILPKKVQSKILSVYFPEDFIQIYTLEKIQIILKSFGITADIQQNLFLAQAQLLEIKNKDPLMRQWNIEDFSHFVWESIIHRSSGKKPVVGANRLFLTAYDRENLETSKKLGILGWKQRPGTLASGDYVFVFNISSKQIDTCFEIKMRSDDQNLLWYDEVDSGKLKYPNRWSAEIKHDSLGIGLDEIYAYEPFKSNKNLFPLLTRNQFPRSLEPSKFADFHAFLLSKIENTYLLLLQQPTSIWNDKEGKEYEYGDNVVNYRKIARDVRVIFRKTKDENGNRLKGGMKFFGHGKISSVMDTGEKGKTLEGNPYDKKIAYISNYGDLDLEESKRKEIENKVKALGNFNRQNAIIPIPMDLYHFIVGDETDLNGGEGKVESDELYEKIREECAKRNLDFEPNPSELAAKGFLISNKNKEFNIYGNILSSKMEPEIWQGITNRLYQFYESNNSQNFVVISDKVKNNFLPLPFELLKPVIYEQKSGNDINKNFNIRRDPYQLSSNNFPLSLYVNNMEVIFALPTLMQKIHYSVEDIKDIEQRLLEKGQLIFYGPPGTGKTFVAEAFAKYFTVKDENIELIQFHPSYSYEDFIEGIRPNETGGFSKKPGVFKRFVEECSKSHYERFVLIIDEINRGDIAKIFGELIYLLLNRNKKITLTYSSKEQDKFAIPTNLYIIATMNSQDRSIAFLDYAIRRRFSMKKFYPDMRVLKTWLDQNSQYMNIEGIISSLKSINKIISDRMDEDFQIGQSYFMEIDMGYDKVQRIIKYDLEPLVEQYFFALRDKQVLEEIKNQFAKMIEFSNQASFQNTILGA